MPVRIDHDLGPEYVKITVSGKLQTEDYEHFVPEIEEEIKRNGKLNLLLVLQDFHGWTAGALWEDLKFDVKHFNDIRRLAIVGDRRWEKGMALFCKPFTTASVRYFDREKLADAESWIAQAAAD